MHTDVQILAKTSPLGGVVPPGATKLTTQHFSELLNPRDGAKGLTPPSREQEARTAATQLVASTLVLPALEQLRDDPFKSKYFDGGSAERAFQSQLDTRMADRVTQAARFPLVDVVQTRLLQKNAHAAAKRSREAGADALRKVDTHG